MSKDHIDEVTGVQTTGHEWDGIRELNNPLPRWWVWTFYATIVWSLGYMIAYPAWPLVRSATSGVLGYSSRADLKSELAAADLSRAEYRTLISEKELSDILADDNLRSFAAAAGGAAFRVNCIQCHGSGAMGSPGYPNLNDDEWLWGGDIDAIRTTIAHGVRFAADDATRVSEMPAFRDILEPAQVSQVSAYVASLSGMAADAALVEPGREVFAQNCAACHGPDGKGDREFGAPDLTDAIGLYVHTPADIAGQIRSPKHGVMPAWNERLGDETVKELAVYVHSLGGGE